MQILVNQEPLDYRLENESSVGDVVDGLIRWLREGQFTVTRVHVDDEEMSFDERADWAGRQLDDVQSISVNAMPVAELEAAALATIAEFLRLLVDHLDSDDLQTVAELMAEMPQLAPRIEQQFPELIAEDSAVRSVVQMSGVPSAEQREEFNKGILQLQLLVTGRLREHLAPEAELTSTIDRLVALATELREVPVALQTGGDKEAMDTVIRLTELFGKALRLQPLATDTSFDLDALDSLLRAVSPHLGELEQAFHTRDAVLIGDLLEYEIAPLLDDLNSRVIRTGER